MADYIPETGYQVGIVATLEVGSAYTHLEESVAREGYMFLFAVEGDSTGSVAWSLQYLELVMTEVNNLIWREESADFGKLPTERRTDDIFELSWEIADEVIVLEGNLRF